MAANERTKVRVHPLWVRITHWINVLAILVMVMSGWRIYNADPLFDFRFPNSWTLGGWLAGALQWHFAAMWLLVLNGAIYLGGGLLSGHFRRKLPLPHPAAVAGDVAAALRGRLAHDDLRVYNAAQRAAYLGVIVLGILVVLSGLVIWKPVQFYALAVLMGDFEGARYVHFLAMAGILLFVAVHLAMALAVPRSLGAMVTGHARLRAPGMKEEG
jgi:thiosulfate reductase cytochrome b subunit